MVFIPVADLKDFMEEVFRKVGCNNEDAKTCADVLITSDLRGITSHGIGRLRMYVDRIYAGAIDPNSKMQIVREGKTTAVIDGRHGIGMVIGCHSMRMAIEKARQYGLGAVAVRDSSHFGIDGYYPLMAVSEGMIGMSFTNARPSVAPTFGAQPILGTNPIAFGAPTDENFPFLFDAATSIIQRGKVEVHNREETPIDNGYVINAFGNNLNDPAEILNYFLTDQASLLPLGGEGEKYGGHKGYGLSTIVEILSSALQSGAFLLSLSGIDKGLDNHYRVGHFFLALDIEEFLPLNEFKRNIGNLLRELRSARKMPGRERIYTAGEKEFLNEMTLMQTGIPINKNLIQDILYIKELLNIDLLSMKILKEDY